MAVKKSIKATKKVIAKKRSVKSKSIAKKKLAKKKRLVVAKFQDVKIGSTLYFKNENEKLTVKVVSFERRKGDGINVTWKNKFKGLIVPSDFKRGSVKIYK